MGKFSFPRLIIRMPWANRTAREDFCTGTNELHRLRTNHPHNSSQLPSHTVCRQGKENTDSTPKKRKKKRHNEKGTQVELGIREDIHDLELAHWRLAKETWRTERGNIRQMKALYGEIFRLQKLLEEIGVDKGVIKQRSTSSILCPVSPTLPALPWYNLHRYLTKSQSECDQHAAATQKNPAKKHSIFPPLVTQSCTSPDKRPHSPSKTSHPHASHRFSVPSYLLAPGPPAQLRQTHPHVHPRSPLTDQAKVKDKVKRSEVASSEELSEEVQRRGAEIENMYKAQLKERMAQKRKEEILKKRINNYDKNDDTEASCSSAVGQSKTPATAPERPASPEATTDATPVAVQEDTQGATQQDLAEVVNVLKRQSSDLYLPDDVCEDSLTWSSIYEELCPLAHRVNSEADYIKALCDTTEKAVTPLRLSQEDVSQSMSEDTSEEGSSESEESMSGQQQRCLHRDPYGERERKKIDSRTMEGRYATANAMSMMASLGKEELNAMSYAERIKYFKDEAKKNEEMLKMKSGKEKERKAEKDREEELKKWEKRQKKSVEEERKMTEKMEKKKLEEQMKREKAEMKLKIEQEKKRQEQEKKREKKEMKKQQMQQKAREKEEKKRVEKEKKREKKRAEEFKKIEKQRMEEEKNREKERMKVLEMQQKAQEKEEKRRKEEKKRRLKIQQEQEKEEKKRQKRIWDEDKKRAELQRIKDDEARFKMEMEKLYEREERIAQIEREKRRAKYEKKGQTQRAKQVVPYQVTAFTSLWTEEREQCPETAHAQSAKRRTRKKQKNEADEALTTFE
ncbi:unnamed protein product [Coregonus sp. 'balchen']|nr:unnamed protein product [Coregonus sp. 'balchen']